MGIPGVSIKAAFIDLPGGAILELLDYQTPGKQPNPEATPNPGNVHLCLAVEIDHGPNVGARGAYLRIHDGVTLELFQPPKRN